MNITTTSRLSRMAGYILLLVGLMFSSCSSEKQETTVQAVDGDQSKVLDSIIVERQLVDTSFYEVVYMVLNAPGIPQTSEYKNNQIVFDAGRWTYTIWATDPKKETPIFSVWRRPKGTPPRSKAIQTWSVIPATGEIWFFLHGITGHSFLEGKYQDSEKKPLTENRVEKLTTYFKKAHAECVTEIRKRYGG